MQRGDFSRTYGGEAGTGIPAEWLEVAREHHKASHGQEGYTCLSHPGAVRGARWASAYTCRVNNCMNGCEALDEGLSLSECQ